MRILVTGGAGFIGSALIRHLIAETGHEVLSLDSLTYAGHLASVEPAAADPRYAFSLADIREEAPLRSLLAEFQPDIIAHLAAETNVDRSIDRPKEFVSTNILGTFTLLAVALDYWRSLDASRRDRFRFHHISTDAVFGSFGAGTEATAYDPHSPYSASKASADMLVRAWHHAYGLPVLTTNCSDNYGPYQLPDKLIPLTIIKALRGEPVPVHGSGTDVRDWLHVDDHVRALVAVFEYGAPGDRYSIGGRSERSTLQLVEAICEVLDVLRPRGDGRAYRDQIGFVSDPPGHDRRCAIDCTAIERALGWRPRETFESGIVATVRWYLTHGDWVQMVIERVAAGEHLDRRAA